MQENLEELTLEELSQKLEAIEKDNEQLRRENQLFDSYILRETKDDRRFDEENEHDKNKQKKRKTMERERWELSAEQKYEIANKELETLKNNIEEGREKSETLLERLKAILEGTDLSIAEIRKEAFDFGRFLSASENGRTGKYDAEKLMKYMEDKFRQKEALIDKLQLKNISLKTQIMKAETQIRHKEEMGDDLKFIDFHQLQIENKKHVKDIDDRNKKLLDLKMTTGKTVISLNILKNKLNTALKDANKIETDIKEKQENLRKTKEDIKTAKANEKKYYTEYLKLKTQQSRTKDMPRVEDYVKQKEDIAILKNSVKNWKRKIEIADIAAKEARRIIKKETGADYH